MRFSLLLLCLLLLGGGCNTRPIPEPASIPIPGSLSQQNVEIAILSALLNQPPPGVYDPRKDMAKEDYEQLVWKHYVTSRRNRGWVVESREPGRVTATISRTRYLIRIQVRYDDRNASVSIVESTGLRQSGSRIHRNAVRWVLTLETRIRAELRRLTLARP